MWTYPGLLSSSLAEVPGFFDADFKLEKKLEGFAVILLAFTLPDVSAPAVFTVDFDSVFTVDWRDSAVMADLVVVAPLPAMLEAFFASDRADWDPLISDTRGRSLVGFAVVPFECWPSTDGSPVAFCFEALRAFSRIC